MTTIFTTRRLRLRLFTTRDVDAQHLVDLNANANVTRYVGEGPVDLETAHAVLRDRILAQHARWGVGRESRAPSATANPGVLARERPNGTLIGGSVSPRGR